MKDSSLKSAEENITDMCKTMGLTLIIKLAYFVR